MSFIATWTGSTYRCFSCSGDHSSPHYMDGLIFHIWKRWFPGLRMRRLFRYPTVNDAFNGTQLGRPHLPRPSRAAADAELAARQLFGVFGPLYAGKGSACGDPARPKSSIAAAHSGQNTAAAKPL